MQSLLIFGWYFNHFDLSFGRRLLRWNSTHTDIWLAVLSEKAFLTDWLCSSLQLQKIKMYLVLIECLLFYLIISSVNPIVSILAWGCIKLILSLINRDRRAIFHTPKSIRLFFGWFLHFSLPSLDKLLN